jgi:hypothetical protein
MDCGVVIQARHIPILHRHGIIWELSKFRKTNQPLFQQLEDGIMDHISWTFEGDTFLVYWNKSFKSLEVCKNPKRRRTPSSSTEDRSSKQPRMDKVKEIKSNPPPVVPQGQVKNQPKVEVKYYQPRPIDPGLAHYFGPRTPHSPPLTPKPVVTDADRQFNKTLREVQDQCFGVSDM